MNDIKLDKNGFFISKRKDAEESFTDVRIDFDVGFFQYWRSSIEIVGIVTLADLVKIINTDGLISLERLTQCSISPFIKEISEEISDDIDLECIEIRKHYEASDYGSFSEIHGVVQCSGKFKVPLVNEHCPGHVNEYCAIEFCHWGSLKNLPIIINPKAELFIEDFKKQGEYGVTLTAADFFNGLFDELCFFGSPTYRDGKSDELKEIVKGVEDGTIKTIPWEEIKEGFKDL